MAFDYKGKLFRLKVGGKTLLHEIEFNFGASTEFQELASKDVNQAFNPGKKTYSLSGNGYADNSTGDAQEDIVSLFTWQDGQTSAAFEIADATSGNLNITGNAYCESIEITSPNNEVVTYSITLKVVDATFGTTA